MTLQDLITELEAATVPSFVLDGRIQHVLTPGRDDMMPPAYSASVDASLRLLTNVLPEYRLENLCEWDAAVLRDRGPWMCDLVERGKDCITGRSFKCSHAPTPAIALVIAICRAKFAQEVQP